MVSQKIAKKISKRVLKSYDLKNVATARQIQNILKIDTSWKLIIGYSEKVINIKNEKVRNLMTYENEYSEPCTRILKYIF